MAPKKKVKSLIRDMDDDDDNWRGDVDFSRSKPAKPKKSNSQVIVFIVKFQVFTFKIPFYFLIM
jgi:hypothetical protein